MAGGDTPGLGDDIRAEDELAHLRGVLRNKERQLVRAKERTAGLIEAVRDGAREAALIVGTPKPVKPPPRDRRKGSPEVAVLHLTDWQLGKRSATYDTDVCRERIRRAVSKTMKLARMQRAARPVREAVVLLGGDLVENVSIFPGQPWEVDSSAFEQVFAAAALVEEAVVSLLGEFQRVTVHEVSGNHGRIGRKGDSPREDNLDRIVGRIARERLAGQQRLDWHEPEGWYAHVEVGAYRAILVHGDQVKSFGGNTPAFGIIRKATSWATGVLPDFAELWMGHFHTPMTLTLPNGGLLRVTGSPESDNQYAAEFVAARGRPSQRLAFIDPEKGRSTADYILWLD